MRQWEVNGLKLNQRQEKGFFTAFHEAGHAAMCLIKGKKFSHVTRRRSENSSGHVAFARTTSPSVVEQIGREILIAVSGLAAELMALRDLEMPDDQRELRIYRIFKSASDDIDRAKEFASFLFPDDDFAAARSVDYVNNFTGLAGQYLSFHAAGFQALTEALARSKRKIGYRAARAIFMNAEEGARAK